MRASLVAQSSKQLACKAGDRIWIPEWGGSSGEGSGNPVQYSCLGNPMDKGVWRAIVHRVTRVGHDLATQAPPWTYLMGFNPLQLACFFKHKIEQLQNGTSSSWLLNLFTALSLSSMIILYISNLEALDSFNSQICFETTIWSIRCSFLSVWLLFLSLFIGYSQKINSYVLTGVHTCSHTHTHTHIMCSYWYTANSKSGLTGFSWTDSKLFLQLLSSL